MRSFISFWIFAGGLAAALGAHAAEPPLATVGALTLTVEELQADFQRIPEQARKTAATDVNAVSQAVANLVVRKAMAAEAIKLKLDQNPQVETQLSLLKDRILSDAWLANIDRNKVVPDAEIEQLAQKKYNEEAFSRFKQPAQIKVRHILFEKSDAGKALAAEVLSQLKNNGVDFAELAKQHSKDPGSAARGGDLGTVGRGRMVVPFEAAAFSLKQAGDLSAVVETEFGHHIIRLDEVLPERIVPFADVKTGLMQEIAAKLRTDARNAAAADMFKQVKLSEDAIQKFVEQAKQSKP